MDGGCQDADCAQRARDLGQGSPAYPYFSQNLVDRVFVACFVRLIRKEQRRDGCAVDRLSAAALEEGVDAKKAVLRRALELVPNSVVLWKVPSILFPLFLPLPCLVFLLLLSCCCSCPSFARLISIIIIVVNSARQLHNQYHSNPPSPDKIAHQPCTASLSPKSLAQEQACCVA